MQRSFATLQTSVCFAVDPANVEFLFLIATLAILNCHAARTTAAGLRVHRLAPWCPLPIPLPGGTSSAAQECAGWLVSVFKSLQNHPTRRFSSRLQSVPTACPFPPCALLPCRTGATAPWPMSRSPPNRPACVSLAMGWCCTMCALKVQRLFTLFIVVTTFLAHVVLANPVVFAMPVPDALSLVPANPPFEPLLALRSEPNDPEPTDLPIDPVALCPEPISLEPYCLLSPAVTS